MTDEAWVPRAVLTLLALLALGLAGGQALPLPLVSRKARWAAGACLVRSPGGGGLPHRQVLCEL